MVRCRRSLSNSYYFGFPHALYVMAFVSGKLDAVAVAWLRGQRGA